jgi:energy-coupling factor transport system substrate-specific component
MTSNTPEQLFGATRWTVRDVLALIVMIIVMGLVFSFWGWAMQVLSRVLGDVVAGLFYGVWFWAGLILAYIIRKPGAALLAEFGAAIVAYLLGGPSGALILALGWVQGLALEMVFAWMHFQHWGLATMLAAGAMAGTASLAVNLVAVPAQAAGYPLGVLIAMLWIAIISGAVLGGLVCKILVDRLLTIAAVQRFLGKPAS